MNVEELGAVVEKLLLRVEILESKINLTPEEKVVDPEFDEKVMRFLNASLSKFKMETGIASRMKFQEGSDRDIDIDNQRVKERGLAGQIPSLLEAVNKNENFYLLRRNLGKKTIVRFEDFVRKYGLRLRSSCHPDVYEKEVIAKTKAYFQNRRQELDSTLKEMRA